MKKIILLFSLIIAMSNGCSKDESPNETTPSTEAEQVYDQVVKPQEDNYNLLVNLLNEMDTLSAMDSVLKIFLKDTLVVWGNMDEQGIAIQYKSGMRGGIFFNPLDILDSSRINLDIDNHLQFRKRGYSNNVIPNSKKTIFINPHYNEKGRKEWADQIIDNYNSWFPAAGYQKPTVYKGAEATLQRFEELSGYGVIHIYSHGWTWPTKDDVEEVYLMTGEEYSNSTFNKYKQQIKSGDIPVVKLKGNTHFYISPKFISNNNNFKSDTTLIYGGFCTSYLGTWPETMIYTAGAGGYFGFDWIVNTDYACKWSIDLFDDLTNVSNSPPTTVTDWINNPKPKWHWQEWGNRIVNLKYLGYSDLALLEKSESPYDESYNWCEIHFSADGIYDSNPTNDYVSVVGEGTGSFTGNKFEAVWNDITSCMPYSGSINVTIDPTTLIASYNVVTTLRDTCQGNNITYKSSFEGSNVPLQLTAENSLKFEVTGLEACRYVSKVEKERIYSNGTRWTLVGHNCISTSWFLIELKNM